MKGMDRDDYKKTRERLIHMVLATDMSKHFADLAKFKSRTTAPDFDPEGTDKVFIMSMALHLADISHAGKRWDMCFKWTDILFIEFFSQGDKERDLGMPISYLMDRYTVNMA